MAAGSRCWPVTGVVLAGGGSRRFGTNKALASLVGRRMIDRVLDVVSPRVSRTLVISNALDLEVGVEVIPDRYPGCGPLGGLATALEKVESAWCLLVACDCPLIEPPVVELLLERMVSSDSAAVVPVVSSLLQPLVAGYSLRCLPAIQHRIEHGQLKMVDLFPGVQVDCVSSDLISAVGGTPWSFFNVNTPEDFALAERYLRGEKGLIPPVARKRNVRESLGSREEQS